MTSWLQCVDSGRSARTSMRSVTEKLVQAEFKRRGWAQGELSRRRKGDPEKVAIAGRLRQETTMSLKWIAHRLQMGSWTYVSNCLVQRKKQAEQRKVKGK